MKRECLCCLQVFLRLQWVREVIRGQSQHLEVDLAGMGTSVMGGLQDELFNLTMDCLKASWLQHWVVQAVGCNWSMPRRADCSSVCVVAPHPWH